MNVLFNRNDISCLQNFNCKARCHIFENIDRACRVLCFHLQDEPMHQTLRISSDLFPLWSPFRSIFCAKQNDISVHKRFAILRLIYVSTKLQ